MSNKAFRVFAFFVTWVFCFLIYLALAWSFSAQELILGAIAAFVVALFTNRFMIRRNPFFLFSFKKLGALIVYALFIFPGEVFRANCQMARFALSKKIDIHPGIVRIPTKMRSDYGLLFLANAITLTPGTLTLEIAQDETGQNYYYIHWINMTTEDRDEAADEIKGRLEKWLGRIWE